MAEQAVQRHQEGLVDQGVQADLGSLWVPCIPLHQGVPYILVHLVGLEQPVLVGVEVAAAVEVAVGEDSNVWQLINKEDMSNIKF